MITVILILVALAVNITLVVMVLAPKKCAVCDAKLSHVECLHIKGRLMCLQCVIKCVLDSISCYGGKPRTFALANLEDEGECGEFAGSVKDSAQRDEMEIFDMYRVFPS